MDFQSDEQSSFLNLTTGEVIFVQVDVTSTSTVEAMISKTVETYGRLDCAHNNAGIGSGVTGADCRVS